MAPVTARHGAQLVKIERPTQTAVVPQLVKRSGRHRAQPFFNTLQPVETAEAILRNATACCDTPQPVATAVAQRASPCLPRQKKLGHGSCHGASRPTSAAVARFSRPWQSRAAAACNQYKWRAAGPAKSPCKRAKRELRKLFLGGVSDVASPQRGRRASG